jgi:voltage-gated potassium channel
MAATRRPRSDEPRAAAAGRPVRRRGVAISARWLVRESLTARGAALIIAAFTLIITVAAAVLARVFDPKDFDGISTALWWALQTVSTVGYGDVTPRHASGRWIAAVVMLVGVGFVAVITASVTAALVENARRRFVRPEDREIADSLEAITARLAAIEAALQENRTPSRDKRS